MPLSKITNPFLDSAGSARSNVYSPSANTIAITTATAERLRVDSSGNVGINTTSPNAKLEIKAASASQRQLQLTHFNSTDGWYFTADDTGGVLKTSRQGGAGLNGEAMRIDSSGRVTKPYQPAFRVTRNSGGNVGADEIIPFDYAILNTGSHFNLSTYTFTAPVAGFYFFSFGGMNSQSNSGATLFRLFINGNQSSYVHIVNSHPSNASNSLVYYMNASDTAYVRGQNYHYGTGSTGNDYPYFSGYLLG